MIKVYYRVILEVRLCWSDLKLELKLESES